MKQEAALQLDFVHLDGARSIAFSCSSITNMVQLYLPDSEENCGGDMWKNLCAFYSAQNTIRNERE